MTNTTKTTGDITMAQIRALRAEAAASGDQAQVDLCDRALAGDVAAFEACDRVIAETVAQDDSGCDD